MNEPPLRTTRSSCASCARQPEREARAAERDGPAPGQHDHPVPAGVLHAAVEPVLLPGLHDRPEVLVDGDQPGRLGQLLRAPGEQVAA
ncbi:hypothetical protein [Nonomuraea insulae]|uniref:Uncharacterized protein n=1 Tax=Nonomuraea insulae TaxID=1616787 RepID=A0ABW1CCX9_9ACTN